MVAQPSPRALAVIDELAVRVADEELKALGDAFLKPQLEGVVGAVALGRPGDTGARELRIAVAERLG